MERSGLRGCESCSALVYAEDVFCPTCGAGVQEAETAAGKVRIPMRRHGVLPVMHEPEIELESDEPVHGGGVRSAIVGLGLTLVAAGATAAAIYQLW